MISAWRDAIDLDHVAATRAVIVLTPLILLAWISGEGIWLRAALVTVSAFIAMERSGLAPIGTILHGAAIIVCYLALVAAQTTELLFILGCVLFAAASILLTGWDARLRSLGNFTFIPALYLACETKEWEGPGNPLHRGILFLPAIMLAILPVLVMSALEHRKTRPLNVSRLWHFRAVLSWAERKEPSPYFEAMVATALAVGLAAHTVMVWRLDQGQWMIWSAASVITGELASGHLKLRDRMVGALVGVPAGIGAGLILPHGVFAHELAILAAALTLVALRPYVIAFGLRCACVTLALMLAGWSPIMAAERASHVILGGLIGIAVVHCVRVAAVLGRQATSGVEIK
ncbi:FUSC family protein [Acidicapsa acidisoli]|uniref:FUSC family protein n=1 Tax=Acidicapsa acidisoli TaxID=1615681 RepID=UPI0021DFA34D|nr:FUSC family protein [Acidicapsa acidisoli]